MSFRFGNRTIHVSFLSLKITRNYRKVSSKKKRKIAASLSEFEEFYQEEFGERWPSIYSSMKLMPDQHCAVLNKYSSREEALKQLQSTCTRKLDTKDLFDESTAFRLESRNLGVCGLECYVSVHKETRFSPPKETRSGYMGYYLLDAASLLPVLALGVKSDSTVLDMCAAPGGKSVLIAQMLSPEGSLVANEPLYSRRLKLSKVIKEYIPSRSGLRETAHVWKLCGTVFGSSEPSTYDQVLVDAPCSSDRHFLENPSLQKWSKAQSTKFAELQVKLLSSALQTVTHNGTVVYSTCTLSPFENDGVIEKVLQGEKGRGLDVIPTPKLNSEFFSTVEMKYGVLVVPSDTRSWGPLYYCKLKCMM